VEDLRIGRALRAIRHRLAWRQVDLARRARVGQSTVSLLERGHIDGLSIRALRRACAALDADLVLLVRWRGGDLNRLLDERHARLGARLARILEALGWEVSPEVTFAINGERGSIDLLAWHAGTRTLLVVEIKSELTSAGDTLRRLDVRSVWHPKLRSSDSVGGRRTSPGCSCCPPIERPAGESRRTAASWIERFLLRRWQFATGCDAHPDRSQGFCL
jgi:transcriptional regulator with XRE-family HTH domain